MDRPLSDDEIELVLHDARVAHLAVVDGSRPYVAPMSFVHVDDSMVFRTGEGRRLEALRHNPQVSIDVMTTDPATGVWRSVVIEGTAEILDDGVGTGRYVTQIIAKYRAAYGVLTAIPDWLADDNSVVVRVRIDSIGGRSNDTTGATRPGRL